MVTMMMEVIPEDRHAAAEHIASLAKCRRLHLQCQTKMHAQVSEAKGKD